MHYGYIGPYFQDSKSCFSALENDNGVRLRLRTFPTMTVFYILPLEGYDLVLGTMVMDIGEDTLGYFKANDEAKVEGKGVLLQGLSVLEDTKIQDAARNKKLRELLQLSNGDITISTLGRLCRLRSTETSGIYHI